MAWTQILSTEVDAESVIDETLMSSKIKNNDDDHEARILALEAVSGSGSAAEKNPEIGTILTDERQFTNVNEPWRRRFHISINSLGGDPATPQSAFDPEKLYRNERTWFFEANSDIFDLSANTDHYLGEAWILAAGEKFSFTLKKGENYFGISSNAFTTATASVTVTVDNQSMTTAGILDETGTARADTFSEAAPSNFFQRAQWFHGLDGEEHTITVENTGAAGYYIDSIIVGYMPRTYAIDRTVRVNAARANVRGTTVDVNQTEVTFPAATGMGYTGAVVCDNTGTISALAGEEPWMSQIRAEETVAFSGAVTDLEVKSATNAPTNGIGLMCMPFGQTHLISWSGTTTTSIQAHQLNNVLFASRPVTDIQVLENFNGAIGEAIGDININYWAKPPSDLNITNANNKVDFRITQNNVTNTFAATLANGQYSANLVPLEDAFKAAMTAANDLGNYGEYFLKYDETSRKWSIGCDSPEVTEIEFLFSTGANQANSLHASLGFNDTDLSGALSYVSDDEKEHLAAPIFEAEKQLTYADDVKNKYSWAGDITPTDEINDIQQRLKFNKIRSKNGQAGHIIYPDHDCSGLALTFVSRFNTSYISIQVDDGQTIYAIQPDATFQGAGDPIKGRIVSTFISFPRGSKTIYIRLESEAQFEVVNDSESYYFVAARQYFTRPPLEHLTSSQAALKAINVAPVSLKESLYYHSYNGNPSNDNVNARTESGVGWGTAAATGDIHASYRFTNTINDYVEFQITIAGIRGGFKMLTHNFATASDKIGVFLSTAAINEGTDRIQNVSLHWYTNWPNLGQIEIYDLPAGTYNIRIKNEDSNTLAYTGYSVLDTVEPDPNSYTIGDLANTDQGMTFAVNTIKMPLQQDYEHKVPSFLQRTDYKLGRVGLVDYSTGITSSLNDYDGINVINHSTYFINYLQNSTQNSFYRWSGLCRSVQFRSGCQTGLSATNTAFIDGRATPSTFSQSVNRVGGAANSVGVTGVVHAFKNFELTCTMSGTTVTIGDTRGIKVDMEVVLVDNVGATEKAVVNSIVLDTSFTVKQSLQVLTAANIVSVRFPGFHSLRVRSDTSSNFRANTLEYEPLELTESRVFKMINSEEVLETVSETFQSYSGGTGLYYPTHSDGLPGTWGTSNINITGMSANTVTYDFKDGLYDGNVAGGNIDVQVTSTKFVPALKGYEVF